LLYFVVMDEKFKKPFDSAETEPRIYQMWEISGYFNPDNLPNATKGPFTIMMPPPNATGVLHMGHMLGCTIQDVLIRFKRLQGYEALWLPGTDHAAIATQSRVEKDISKSEGKNRHELGREELLKRIDTSWKVAAILFARRFVQRAHRAIGRAKHSHWMRRVIAP
jgi:valyl-tRNA synthetase